MEKRIGDLLRESIGVKQALLEGPLEPIARAAEALAEALRRGGKVLLFGNGGSAADAQHVAAELVNRFLKTRPPLAAVALTTDSSILTSIANDDDFEMIFARQIRALGSPGDIAWGLSTSGKSRNVILGLEEAKALNMVTIGMTGGSPGGVGRLSDHWIGVNHTKTPRIQEAHITLAHILCELVEDLLFSDTMGG